MTKWIYEQPIPEWAPNSTGAQAQRRASLLTALQGSGSAESIGLEPGQRSLSGSYIGEDADVLAQELRELADAPGISEVPVHDDAGTSDWEGYYVLDGLTAEPPEPQAEANLQTYRIALQKTGTRRTHWRSVGTSKQSVSNDFGSGTATEIGVPAKASMVRWWDGDAGVEYPSPTATRTGEHRDVEIYDVDAASYSNPTLLYSLAYSEEGRADCVVWDTRGFASKTDANGNVDWGRVYTPDHEFAGDAVLSSRILRVTIDEANQSISAERWDSANSTWASVSLGTSDWVPLDVDIRTIAPARLEARVLFQDTTGGSRYPLDMVLCRGDTDALWKRTPNATSATPTGLVTLLDPIAQTTVYDAGEQQGLTKREEVEQ